VNLRSIDLNLLVVFDQLMRTRSVTVTAHDLAMTPSAVSHALSRLRLLMSDELLVRSPEGFQPTRRAEEVHASLGDALRTIEWAMDNQVEFEPGRSTRTFTLHLSDYIGAFLLPALCERLRAVAPGIKLNVERHFAVPERADPGELQVRVGWVANLAEYRHERLFEDDYVVVMRADHPAADRPLDAAAYAALAHVKVSSVALGTSAIDDALAARALARHVAVTVANWFEAARIVARSDLVAAMPRPWATLERGLSHLVERPLPLEEVRFVVQQCWHPGKDSDVGHRWFRSQVKQVFDDRAWLGAPA
jgi:DNA-binding transcriptional LysR family regulator